MSAALDVTGGPGGGELFERELGKVGEGGEGTLQMPWSPRGTDYPRGPAVKGTGSTVFFSCCFKLNLNQENVSKLLEKAWAEVGGGDEVK